MQYDKRRLSYLSRFDSAQKRNKQLKTQIKIVKRNPDPTQTNGQDEFESKPVEPSTREITIVVKKWIAELKERKSNHNAISPK